MADLTLTAAQIALCDDGNSPRTEVYSFICAAAMTPGLAAAWNSSGKLIVSDANVAGVTAQMRGIALRSAAIGDACTIVKKGRIYGYDLSGLAYGAKVYLSDTAGALADAASATKTVTVGQVMPLSDSDVTKVLYISLSWTEGY